ncbi:MAG: dUTP diphosphatase [Tissierellia bacterium]|nr:dUTP diphosphatase [Tissierellia bacterium]
MMKIKFINESSNELPSYSTPGASGMDLRANLEEPVIVAPMEIKLIPTGIKAEVPLGYEIQVRARSGLALKHGISLVNGVGTIDSDYRGEIGVILINLGKEDFTINNGDRIAQLVVAKYEYAEIEEVKELTETGRDPRGFGSSGIK